jgi:hypothetical protein
MSQQLALSNNGNRRELDFYPTPPEVTAALMTFLNFKYRKTIWEPAAGEGHMAKIIRLFGHSVIETDIQTGQDFLKTEPRDCDALITNPPFNLSEKFIRRAIAFDVPVIAMLLKSQYWHAAVRYKLFCKHPPTWILPITWRADFLLKNGNPTMDVLWSVWIAGDTATKYQPLLKPKCIYNNQLLFNE